jgi:hypothetical protein
MSRHSLARALLSILAALFLASTATPAEAKPRGWREHEPRPGAEGAVGPAQNQRESLVLRKWTLCRNGATLTIAADRSVGPLLRLEVRSRGRVVWRPRDIRLEVKPLSIRYLWRRTPPPTVMRDSPDRPPEIIPRTRYRYSRTVKLRWRLREGTRLPPAGTVRLSMGPADRDLEPGILRVRNCDLLGGGFQLG